MTAELITFILNLLITKFSNISNLYFFYSVLQMRHNISGVLDKLNNKCHDMWLHKEGHETWKGMNAYTNI